MRLIRAGRTMSAIHVAAAAAVLALTLGLPGVALAANTATFSAKAPASGSISAVTQPKITVTVSDKYGVKGASNYVMTIDGRVVRPSIAYVKGQKNKKFTLTYRVPSPLSSAVHTVVVRVKDLKKRASSVSWSFTVDALPPVTTDDAPRYFRSTGSIHLAATDAGSGVATTYYILDNFFTQGNIIVIGNALRDYTLEYWSVDNLGNTEVHHIKTVTRIDYHALPDLSVSCFATGCHTGGTSLSTIHNPLVQGANQGCWICHTVGPKTADCSTVGCHSDSDTAHQTISSPHTSHPAILSNGSGACTSSGCHDSGFQAVHGTCATCHNPAAGSSVPATTALAAIAGGGATCQTCHGPASHDLPGLHAASPVAATLTINGADYGVHACSECHTSLDLRTIHGENGTGNSCAKCHAVSVKTTLGSTWLKGCVQGGCHTLTSQVPMHAGIDTTHTLAVTPSCTGGDCHAGGRDVAAIHAALTGRSDHGCGICHGAGQTPTLVCATAGCHDSGLPADHHSHPATVSTGTIVIDAITYANRVCADCHGNLELQAQHGENGTNNSCAKCHPQPAGSVARGSFACAQGNCHAGTAPAALQMHASVNASHTVATTPACIATGCHTGGRNVATIHSVVPGRSDNGCGICHATGVTPTLVCASTGCHAAGLPADHSSHVSTVTAGTITILGTDYTNRLCSDCHSPLELQQLHGEVNHNLTSCVNCHPSPATSAAKGSFACAQGNCHAGTAPASLQMHASVNASHTLSYTPTCIGTGCHTGGTNVVAIHKVVPGRTDSGCGICHASGITPTLVCASTGCHAAGLPADHSSHVSTVTAGTITILGTAYTNKLCSDCHSPLELQQLHGEVNHNLASCVNCHPSPATSAAKGDFACAQGNCHAGTAPASLQMHASVNASHTLSYTPTCVGAGCHTGGTNVVAIHAVVPGRSDNGCGICHAVGKTATLVCASAGCHAAGLPADHTSHESTVTTGTITILGTAYNYRKCADCHTPMELQQLHGEVDHNLASCVNCHPTPATSAAKGNFTCAQGNCHAGTAPAALQMHASVNASHTLSYTPTCIGNGCHTGGTNVVAIHAVVPGRSDSGCGICHASGVTATLVCATTGCHAAGLPADHASHDSTVTTGTITILGTAYNYRHCSDCHTPMELQQLHGEVNHNLASCVNCHPNPAASATKGSFACAQGNCHAGTAPASLQMHASVNASHTLSYTPTCIGTGCHTGGTNVVAIHQVVPGRTDSGCGICHASGITPTLVCATSGCHTAGLPADHSSHESTVTTGTITILGTAYNYRHCSDCHTPMELQQLHGEVNHNLASCVNCHPNPAASASKGNFACAQGNCHAGTAPASLQMHASVNASHTLSYTPTCIGTGCHTGGTNVVAIHSAVPGRTDSGCGICHSAGTTATLVCATTGCHAAGLPADHTSHVSTATAAVMYVNGIAYGTHACSDCHSPMELQQLHGEVNHNLASCVNCHPNPATSATRGNFACAQGNCHAGTAPASLQMHGSITTSHTLSYTPTCVAAGCHAGGTNVVAIHSVVPGRSDNGCGICHAAGTTATLICATSGCHPTGAPPSHASHPSTVTVGTITINGVAYPNQSCADCHAPLELQQLHGENGSKNSCVKCHPSPASSVPGGSFACAQGDCHAGTAPAALQMHANADNAHTVATTPSCIASGCHTGGRDVAAIHAVSGGPGCICHKSGYTLTTDCQQSGCHTGGYPADHQSHPASVVNGDIHIGGVDYGIHACSECHGTIELQALHGEDGSKNSCAKCHPSPRNSFSTWNGTCVQGGCHVAGTSLAQHGGIDSAHNPGQTSCVTSTCHADGDLAAIHAGATKGCGTCHDGRVLTTDCTAPQCHGTTDPHPPHTPSVTSADFQIGGVDFGVHSCSECHGSDMDLRTVHGGTSGCATCHPTPRNTFTTWNGTCVQGGCHSVGASAMHSTMQSSHVASSSPCFTSTCHAGGNVAIIHKDTPKGCGSCHAPGVTPSLDCSQCHGLDVAALHPTGNVGHTPSVHPCTTASGCHSNNAATIHAPSATSCKICHADGTTPTANCTSCHPLPVSSPHVSYMYEDYHGYVAGNGTTDYGAYSTGWLKAPYMRNFAIPCVTCHDPNGTTNMYNFATVVNGQAVSVKSGPEYVNLCTACHGGTVDDWHAGCFDCHGSGMTDSGPTDTMVGTDCSDCHHHGSVGWPHGGWMGGVPTL